MTLFRIYVARCLATGLEYVGQTALRIEERWADKYPAGSSRFYGGPGGVGAAILEHGRREWELEWVASATTREAALDIEAAIIQTRGTLHPNGYNVAFQQRRADRVLRV